MIRKPLQNAAKPSKQPPRTPQPSQPSPVNVENQQVLQRLLDTNANSLARSMIGRLQTVYGNHTVQRMVKPDAIIQRYTQPNASDTAYRVSKNAKIVITGKQTLFATLDAIREANEALAKAGGVGAYIRLASNDAKHADYPELVGVKPVWESSREIAKDDSPAQQYRRNVKAKNATESFCTHADCHLAATTIMGSEDSLAGEGNTERPMVRKATGNTEALSPVEKQLVSSPGDPTHIAHRGTYAFFLEAMPRFAALIETSGKTDQQALVTRIREAGNIADLKSRILEYMKLYREIAKDSTLAQQFAIEFGVNEAAQPQVGDALMQVNDELEKKVRDKSITDYNENLEKTMTDIAGYIERMYTDHASAAAPKSPQKEWAKKIVALAARIREALAITEESPRIERLDQIRQQVKADDHLLYLFEDEATLKNERPDDMWNFHWAGVVMRDGEDYVTLENLSTEFASDINTRWYFQMYGPNEQSFHSEASEDTHVGEYPLTLPFRTFNESKFGEDDVKRFVEKEGKLTLMLVASIAVKGMIDSTYKIHQIRLMPVVKNYIKGNPWITPYIDAAELTKVKL